MKNLPQLEPEGHSGVWDSADEVQFQPAFKDTLSIWAVLTGLPDSHAWRWPERSLRYGGGGLDSLNPKKPSILKNRRMLWAKLPREIQGK